MRILDIEIPPFDTTLFHRHDEPIAYVFISLSPTKAQELGQEWGRVSGGAGTIGNISVNAAYATAPVAHRVTNLGDTPFRLIAVLNGGPGQSASGSVPLGTAGPPEKEDRWFRSTHRTLADQATWEWEASGRPVVIVQVSSGAVVVELAAGSTHELRASGDFVVLPSGTRAQLRSVGPGPVTLGIVEVR
jgi:quercetin dioxygenase-like cupin family protein